MPIGAHGDYEIRYSGGQHSFASSFAPSLRFILLLLRRRALLHVHSVEVPEHFGEKAAASLNAILTFRRGSRDRSMFAPASTSKSTWVRVPLLVLSALLL